VAAPAKVRMQPPVFNWNSDLHNHVICALSSCALAG
jgi:hypothetical protein